jgi:hypothetical protein
MADGFTKIYSRVVTRPSTANQRGPSLSKAENVDVDAHKSRTQSSAAGIGQGHPGLPGDCHDLCRRQCDCLRGSRQFIAELLDRFRHRVLPLTAPDFQTSTTVMCLGRLAWVSASKRRLPTSSQPAATSCFIKSLPQGSLTAAGQLHHRHTIIAGKLSSAA